MTDIRAMLREAGAEAQYDENAKWLISQKPFLANVLTRTVKEFEGMNSKEVESLIEGEPSVGQTPVEEGFTNMRLESGKMAITGMNTERKVHHEGVTYYDVLFYVRTGVNRAKIIVNLELQKGEPAAYDIEMRGIFYAAREISSQLGREFGHQKYNDMKKVYSIWICMNAKENSLNKISLHNENVLGKSGWKEWYRVLNVVIIRLEKELDAAKEHELHRLLGAVFGTGMPQAVRENILEREFGIELETAGKERLNTMCNLGEGIREMALEEGMEKGLEKGMEKGLEKGKALGIIETCVKLNMPEEDVIEKLKEIMKVSDEVARKYYDEAMMQVV